MSSNNVRKLAWDRSHTHFSGRGWEYAAGKDFWGGDMQPHTWKYMYIIYIFQEFLEGWNLFLYSFLYLHHPEGRRKIAFHIFRGYIQKHFVLHSLTCLCKAQTRPIYSARQFLPLFIFLFSSLELNWLSDVSCSLSNSAWNVNDTLSFLITTNAVLVLCH